MTNTIWGFKDKCIICGKENPHEYICVYPFDGATYTIFSCSSCIDVIEDNKKSHCLCVELCCSIIKNSTEHCVICGDRTEKTYIYHPIIGDKKYFWLCDRHNLNVPHEISDNCLINLIEHNKMVYFKGIETAENIKPTNAQTQPSVVVATTSRYQEEREKKIFEAMTELSRPYFRRYPQ
jgi:hypothetical protein